MAKQTQNNQGTGKYIRKWRAIREIKQGELAKLLNISTSTLSKYENNKMQLSPFLKHQIAYHLKITFDQLQQDPQVNLR